MNRWQLLGVAIVLGTAALVLVFLAWLLGVLR